MRALLALLLVTGCSHDPSGSDGATNSDGPLALSDLALSDLAGVDLSMTATVGDGGGDLVQKRPYSFHVPTGYDKNVATPLLILLHGYSASGGIQEAYFQLTPVADAHTFLYAYPDGTTDQTGNKFWNADDACCDLYHTGVDDVAYVNAIIDDVEKKYNVDPKRVFLVGHSNGAFMSHRLACDSAPRIASIVALAGEVWNDMSKCQPSDHVSVLQIQGTLDTVVPYNGGNIAGVQFPSAPATAMFWAGKEGCTPQPDSSAPPLDIDSGLPGNETTVERWLGCATGDVELWTIVGGSHVPALQPTWGETIYGYLSSHPKP